jgi:hypothetical protein
MTDIGIVLQNFGRSIYFHKFVKNKNKNWIQRSNAWDSLAGVWMKMDRIPTDTADIDTDNFSFSDRIWIHTIYFVSNSDRNSTMNFRIQCGTDSYEY